MPLMSPRQPLPKHPLYFMRITLVRIVVPLMLNLITCELERIYRVCGQVKVLKEIFYGVSHPVLSLSHSVCEGYTSTDH